MGRKFVFILKLLIGAYLIFVGVILLKTVLDEQPSNLQVMCVASSVFILFGIGYVIAVFGSALKKRMTSSALKYIEEPEMPTVERPVRDKAMFRTAPMVVLGEEKQERPSEGRSNQGHTISEKSSDRTSDRNSATIQLQKVGPDTMVWKK